MPLTIVFATVRSTAFAVSFAVSTTVFCTRGEVLKRRACRATAERSIFAGFRRYLKNQF